MYSKCGKKELAKHIFYKMLDLDFGCWNSMGTCCSFNSFDKEAVTSWKDERIWDVAYLVLLCYCTKLLCKAIFFFWKETSLWLDNKIWMCNDVSVGSALIAMWWNRWSPKVFQSNAHCYCCLEWHDRWVCIKWA